MDAQHRRRAALVAIAMLQDFDEEWDFEFAQRNFVKIVRTATIQVTEVSTDGIGDVLA